MQDKNAIDPVLHPTPINDLLIQVALNAIAVSLPTEKKSQLSHRWLAGDRINLSIHFVNAPLRSHINSKLRNTRGRHAAINLELKRRLTQTRSESSEMAWLGEHCGLSK